MLSIISSFFIGLGLDVDTDVSPVEVGTSLHPDLVIRDYRRKRTFLLDLKVPYDSLANFTNSRAANFTNSRRQI